jgi:poly-beta-hydroxybutyrate-responsive repressor
MPGRRGWLGGRGDVCPRRILRFVEPVLLLLLHTRPAHGYDLMERLKPYGFEENPLDSSAVYRALRDMEERGLVTSDWETESAGPARRVYRLTSDGDQHLSAWVADLRETDKGLHHFLDMYETHMEEHG